MGLDTVELVMAFEEAFEISISDEAAGKIVTVRDAIDHIYSQVRHSESSVCRTQRAFYRLRRVVQSELGVERARLKPATKWAALIPADHRREAWSRLGSVIGCKRWPTLERSKDVRFGIAGSALASALIAYSVAPAYNAASAAIVGMLAIVTATRSTSRWRIHFPKADMTVGQIAELLATYPPNDWRTSTKGWTREQVRMTVRKIVAEQLNVEPTFGDDDAFVDDLGAD